MLALFKDYENKKREQNIETADEVEGKSPEKDEVEEASDG
jgi:hypothetical protein